VRAQKNALDCGLHVVSFIYSAIQSDGKLFDTLLERENLYKQVLESIPEVRLLVCITLSINKLYRVARLKYELLSTNSRRQSSKFCFVQPRRKNYAAYAFKKVLLSQGNIIKNYATNLTSNTQKILCGWSSYSNESRLFTSNLDQLVLTTFFNK
jgi:hypothetical protein